MSVVKNWQRVAVLLLFVFTLAFLGCGKKPEPPKPEGDSNPAPPNPGPAPGPVVGPLPVVNPMRVRGRQRPLPGKQLPFVGGYVAKPEELPHNPPRWRWDYR